MSVWIRSRRDTGMATSGGGGSSPGQRSTSRDALGRALAGASADGGPSAGGSAGLRSGVLLTLRFLALPLHARLLVMLAAASLGEDAGLLDLLVEATQGAFERLVLTHSDFCQSRFTSSGSVLGSWRRARSHRRGAVPPPTGGRAAGA